MKSLLQGYYAPALRPKPQSLGTPYLCSTRLTYSDQSMHGNWTSGGAELYPLNPGGQFFYLFNARSNQLKRNLQICQSNWSQGESIKLCHLLVLGLDRRSSITTALRDLHWLLVMHRITVKVATLMHQTLHRRCPAYLADLVAFSSTDSHRQ